MLCFYEKKLLMLMNAASHLPNFSHIGIRCKDNKFYEPPFPQQCNINASERRLSDCQGFCGLRPY